MKGLKIRVPDVPAYIALPEGAAAPTRRRSPSPRSTWRCRTARSTRRRTRCRRSRRRSSTRCRRTSSLTGHIVDALLTRGRGQHVWSKLSRRREEDLHRGDAGGRRARPAARSRSARRELVDEFKKKGNNVIDGRQERLPRRRAEDDQADRPWATASRTTTASSSDQVARHAPACASSATARRRWPIDDEGHFHVEDEAVDLVRHDRSRAGSPSASSGCSALTVFYQFFTRYVLNDSAAWTEEIARYLLIGVVFVGAAIGVAKNNHIQVDFFYRYLPAPVGRWLSHAGRRRCASPSSPPRLVLTVPDDGQDRQPHADDDRRRCR